LNYFYYIHRPEQSIKKIFRKQKHLKKVRKVISFFHSKDEKIDEITYDRLIYGWVSYVKNNNEAFLEHGNALLMFAIEINDLELVDNIYMKCLNLFNQDLENNKAFLTIITASMPLMNEYYPEYVTRFSLDTNMIIDSSDYKIEYF